MCAQIFCQELTQVHTHAHTDACGRARATIPEAASSPRVYHTTQNSPFVTSICDHWFNICRQIIHQNHVNWTSRHVHSACMRSSCQQIRQRSNHVSFPKLPDCKTPPESVEAASGRRERTSSADDSRDFLLLYILETHQEPL